jgi:hypothetical protein
MTDDSGEDNGQDSQTTTPPRSGLVQRKVNFLNFAYPERSSRQSFDSFGKSD